MNEGKALVLGTVLKYERPFKAAIIGTSTGLSRQLVRYHLSRLVDIGALVKEGSLYIVSDKEILINSLIDASSGTERKRGNNTMFFNQAEELNMVLEFVASIKTLRLEKSVEFQTTVLSELDATISMLKGCKKWLTESSIAAGSAKKKLLNHGALKEMFIALNGTEAGYSEWIASVRDELDE